MLTKIRLWLAGLFYDLGNWVNLHPDVYEPDSNPDDHWWSWEFVFRAFSEKDADEVQVAVIDAVEAIIGDREWGAGGRRWRKMPTEDEYNQGYTKEDMNYDLE